MTYGYFTNGKGRILSDGLVLALPDRIWIEIPAGCAQAVKDHLVKYIVADRVEVRSLGDFVQVALMGSPLEALWSEVFSQELPTGNQVVVLGRTQLFVHRHPLLGVPAVQFWVSSGIAEPVLEDLLATCHAVLAGWRELEQQRIAAGVPRFGRDFDATHLPAEVAMAGAVAFDKGCYLGQEIVARLHYRGQAAREIRRLTWSDGPDAIDPGTTPELAVFGLGDRSTDTAVVAPEVGRVTSWCTLAGGESRALAMLRRSELDAPKVLVEGLPSRITAEVVGPPPPWAELAGS
jgi:folate-binding protein YgfZ